MLKPFLFATDSKVDRIVVQDIDYGLRWNFAPKIKFLRIYVSTYYEGHNIINLSLDFTQIDHNLFGKNHFQDLYRQIHVKIYIYQCDAKCCGLPLRIY